MESMLSASLEDMDGNMAVLHCMLSSAMELLQARIPVVASDILVLLEQLHCIKVCDSGPYFHGINYCIRFLLVNIVNRTKHFRRSCRGLVVLLLHPKSAHSMICRIPYAGSVSWFWIWPVMDV